MALNSCTEGCGVQLQASAVDCQLMILVIVVDTPFWCIYKAL